jgi:hypothetical protein
LLSDYKLDDAVGLIDSGADGLPDAHRSEHNQRGTAEHWIREGKGAIKWTRLSCRAFTVNAVRLQRHALAYNLTDAGAAQGGQAAFQMAEVALSRQISADILMLIAVLWDSPAPA